MPTKSRKMDRYLISKQPWEIKYVRVIFYRWIDGEIIHPYKQTVLNLIKENGRSRKKVYKALEDLGFKNITKKEQDPGTSREL